MTADEADACHTPTWDDAEIATFIKRRDRLLRWGYSAADADDLAERLTLRDRQADDRRLCLECDHLDRGLCANWRMAGYTKPEAVLPRVLQRCPGFATAQHMALDQPERSDSSMADANPEAAAQNASEAVLVDPAQGNEVDDAYTVALQMRKSGIPLEVARLVLLGCGDTSKGAQ